MEKIRSLSNIWAKMTYRELLSTVAMDHKTRRKLARVIKDLGLLNRKVTGESVTGLEKTAEVGLGGAKGISYTQAFSLALNEDSKALPLLYLKHLVLNFEHVEQSRLKGIIARGLRTLPSLLRDRDFAEGLKTLAPRFLSGVRIEVTVNPGIDAKEHTDVFLKMRNKVYRIWLYQFTPRGLPHDTERVLGKRGSLPDGVHILCPIKTLTIMEMERLERKMTRLTLRVKRYGDRYRSYKNKKCKGAKKLLGRTAEIREELEETKKDYKRIKSLADAEAISVNGWYFYSDKKIEELISKLTAIIAGKAKPDSYPKVRRILSGPEKYLSEIRIFQK